MAGEGELLLVGDVLIAEHQHGVLVHAGLDRRNLIAAESALRQSMPETSAAKAGCSWRNDTGIYVDPLWGAAIENLSRHRRPG